jgi:phosphoribosylglycinamide formyltransferase-1
MRLAVLVSGSGTIMEALFEAGLPVTVVLADRPCAALSLAGDRGAAVELVDRRDYGGFGEGFDREAFTAAVTETLVAHQVDLIAMAGFGTVLTETVHRAFPNRILNTHPALLPQFPGWHAVRDALAAGVRETGCTVHLATVEMDAGPVLAQKEVRVVAGDSEQTLHERIKVVERVLYPATVAWALEELQAGREIARPVEAIPGTAFAVGREGRGRAADGRGRRAAVPPWRLATAPLRPLPDIMIVGAQRGGTTSLRTWLRNHSQVKVREFGEVHYFDHNYDRGEHWYRSRFPMRFRPRRLIETSPYMLFHPLAPKRAGHDLPAGTRFVVLLREPAERALSHYRLERALGRESKSFADALEAEHDRLAGEEAKVLGGERSRSHQWFSYRSRGLYAEQVSRWFDAVDPARVKVVESEGLFDDAAVGEDLLRWLDFPAMETPFPSLNASPAPTPEDEKALLDLRAFFEPHNEKLFELLGRRFWDT